MDRQNDRGGESGLQGKNWLYWLGPLCESRGSSTGRRGRHGGGGGGGDGDGTLRRYTNPFTLRGCILTANARDVAMRMDLVSQARRNIWGHWGLVPLYFWQFQKGVGDRWRPQMTNESLSPLGLKMFHRAGTQSARQSMSSVHDTLIAQSWVCPFE